VILMIRHFVGAFRLSLKQAKMQAESIFSFHGRNKSSGSKYEPNILQLNKLPSQHPRRHTLDFQREPVGDFVSFFHSTPLGRSPLGHGSGGHEV
jgi:hypothetical protein